MENINTYNTINYICGDENYLKENMLKNIRNKYIEIYGDLEEISFDNPSIEELYSIIADPILTNLNVFLTIKIGEGLNKELSKDKSRDELKNLVNLFKDEENILDILEDKIIVFFDCKKPDKKNALFNELQKHTIIKNKKKINIFEYKKIEKNDLFNFAKQYAKSINLDLNDKEIRYILENIDNDSTNIVSEFDKLSFLESLKSNEINRLDQIDDCIYKTTTSVVFEVTDLIFSNIGIDSIEIKKKAFEKLDDLKESPYITQLYIYKLFRNLYLTKLSIEENTNLSSVLNLPATQKFMEKRFVNWSKKLSEEKIKYIYYELQDLMFNQRNVKIDILEKIKQILSLVY